MVVAEELGLGGMAEAAGWGGDQTEGHQLVDMQETTASSSKGHRAIGPVLLSMDGRTGVVPQPAPLHLLVVHGASNTQPQASTAVVAMQMVQEAALPTSLQLLHGVGQLMQRDRVPHHL